MPYIFGTPVFGLGTRIPIPPNLQSAPRNTFGSLPVEERFLAVFEEILRFKRQCDYKSEVLTWLASRRSNLRRHLNFISGLITMISGGAVWAIVTNVLTSTSLQYASAVCSFAGGLCTLITTHFLDNDQTERLLSGVAKFRTLALDASIDLFNPAFIELQRTASARQLSTGPSAKPDLNDEQRKEFRAAGDLAYTKLADLQKRLHETIEFEQYIQQAQTRENARGQKSLPPSQTKNPFAPGFRSPHS